VWIAAAVVGGAAVGYARLIALVQSLYFSTFERFPFVTAVSGPFFFVGAAWIVRQFGRDAKGSGIPQVLVAIQNANQGTSEAERWQHSLVSARTAAVKVLSSVLGIFGGASIGREGPTVQIAAAGFAWFGQRLRKYAPQIEFRTFLTAGAAAGVAAAFNTPIAGIAFAIEELGGDAFGIFRQMVMLAIIVSGIVSLGLSGNYLYFGRPVILNTSIVAWVGEAMAIGLIGGLLGGIFARALANPQWLRIPRHWLVRALVTGVLCSAIGYWTHGDTAGSGYEATRRALESANLEGMNPAFPLLKLATTALSYVSGMAGGIFSPCLSIGAGIGLAVAKLAGLANFRACALFGMVAFFSGAVRAPLTAVIIVMEMTDEPTLAIPFMIAAFLAHSAGRRVMSEPLYHYLARNYRSD
jgi:H+/Cl- antiporter ClcA